MSCLSADTWEDQVVKRLLSSGELLRLCLFLKRKKCPSNSARCYRRCLHCDLTEAKNGPSLKSAKCRAVANISKGMIVINKLAIVKNTEKEKYLKVIQNDTHTGECNVEATISSKEKTRMRSGKYEDRTPWRGTVAPSS